MYRNPNHNPDGSTVRGHRITAVVLPFIITILVLFLRVVISIAISITMMLSPLQYIVRAILWCFGYLWVEETGCSPQPQP